MISHIASLSHSTFTLAKAKFMSVVDSGVAPLLYRIWAVARSDECLPLSDGGVAQDLVAPVGGPHPEGPHSWRHFLEVGGWAEDVLSPEHHQLSGDGGDADVVRHGRDYQ